MMLYWGVSASSSSSSSSSFIGALLRLPVDYWRCQVVRVGARVLLVWHRQARHRESSRVRPMCALSTVGSGKTDA